MALSRDQIKASNDTSPEEVEVPEWGGTLLLAWPSVNALTAMQDVEKVDGVDLLIACAVDDKGAPLFTDPDREWLGDKSAAVVSRVVVRITEMFEALEGNSGSAPDGATSSD